MASIGSDITAKDEALLKNIQETEKAYDKLSDSQKKNEKVYESLQSRMNSIKDSMSKLILEGKKETDQYAALREELLTVSTAYKIVEQEQKRLSVLDPFLTGISDGITGISGALSAFQSASTLFANSNKEIAEIQSELQHVMSITTGLQQAAAKVTLLWNGTVKVLNTQLGLSLFLSKALATGGIGVLIAAVTYAVNKYRQWSAEQERLAERSKTVNNILKEASLEGIKNASQESAQLKLLYGATQDVNRSQEDRFAAAKELKNLYPSFLENLSKEDILAGRASVAYEDLSQAILRSAKARAAADKIAQNALKILDLEEQKQELESKRLATQETLDKQKVTTFDPRISQAQVFTQNHMASNISEYDDGIRKITDSIEDLNRASEKLAENINIGDLLFSTKDSGNSTKTTIDNHIKLAEELLSLEKQNMSNSINLMEDGYAKRLALIDFNYDTEISEIKKRQEEWQKAQNGQLSTEQEISISNASTLAKNKKDQDTKSLDDEYLNKERQSWIEYNKEFGDYQEKRLAIAEDYEQKIAAAETGGEKASLAAQRDKALQELDISMIEQSDVWKSLFEDLDKQTSQSINEIIAQTENLLNYLKGVEGVEAPDIFPPEQLESLKKDPKKVEKALEDLKKKRDELNSKSPFGQLIAGFQDLKNAGTETEKKLAFTKIASGIQSVGATLSEIGNAWKNVFGKGAGEVIDNITKSINGLTQVGSGATKLMAGDITGAVDILKGIPSVIEGIGGLFGARSDDEKLFKQIERYEELVGLYDKLIDKQNEYLKKTTGTEATKQAEETEKLIERRQEAERKKLAAWFDTGASRNHHSMWYRINRDLKKEINAEGIKDIREVLQYGESQWKDLQKNIELWEKLPKEVRAYGEAVIGAKEDTEALAEALRESVTGISFSSLKDSLDDIVTQADLSFEDIANSFEGHMSKAILNTIKKKYLNEELDKWHKQLQYYASDGTISQADKEELERYWKEIVTTANEKYKQDMALAGIDISKPENDPLRSSDQASSKGIQSITQDSASELIGQFRGMRMDFAEVAEYLKTKDTNKFDMSGDVSLIAINTTDSLNIFRQQLQHQAAIERNTFRTAQILGELNNSGFKIKEGS